MKIKIDKTQFNELINLKKHIERFIKICSFTDVYINEMELTEDNFEKIAKEIQEINLIGKRRFKSTDGINITIASSNGTKLAIK